MISIIYFGKLKEQLSVECEQIDWKKGSIKDLLDFLCSRNATWSDALSEQNVFRVAINKEIIIDHNATIPDQAEIAILPPVTGG